LEVVRGFFKLEPKPMFLSPPYCSLLASNILTSPSLQVILVLPSYSLFSGYSRSS
jgi:hypothetical protein